MGHHCNHGLRIDVLLAHGDGGFGISRVSISDANIDDLAPDAS
jgi:hypothetical protein